MSVSTIFDIQRNSFVDGPGIRTTVFFKGCNLRCKWCHNPESQNFEKEILFYQNKCTGCGRCKDITPDNTDFLCFNNAKEVCGKEYTVDEVFCEIIKDKAFYETSGGGVTFSGGECMLQIDFLTEILKKCKGAGIHTAIDTAGHIHSFDKILPYTDMFLYDIKIMNDEKHKEYTGVTNKLILKNLAKLLKSEACVWVRIPIISGINDTEEEMESIRSFFDTNGYPEKVELLPYHAMGEHKYAALGRDTEKFDVPDKEKNRRSQKSTKDVNIMYIAMDMGTSNTRLWLCDNNEVISCKKGAFGAGSTKSRGREYLFDSLKALIGELLSEGGISASEIKYTIVSGMAGSEIGLCDIPHIPLPADIYKLSDSVEKRSFPEITEIPFVFVPGLKKMNGELLADIMRGEETEVAGILSSMSLSEDCIFVLPGTHNKIISVLKSGEITDFCTTFSGELINGLISNSVLSGDVSHEFEINEASVFAGSEYAKRYGINAALFHIRVMMKNGKNKNDLSSFLYGAVIGQDIDLIHRISGGKRIYVGGRENLRRVYTLLLGEESAAEICDEAAGSAVLSGLMQIYKLISARDERAKILSAIEKEKLIAIIRAPEEESFIPAMQAMYDGGVRLAEITYDRTRKQSAEYTAGLIKAAVDKFGDDMFIGAGTVTSPEEVMLTYNAGGKFIISPNCDAEIIKLTKKLGLVSIPAAFTPTEIADAIKAGADFVKLFPADQVSAGYVKAVSAPLSDAKLLAVGGVDVSNAGEMIKRGFCGVGIGSNLYDKKLIREGKFTELSELAKSYAEAVK